MRKHERRPTHRRDQEQRFRMQGEKKPESRTISRRMSKMFHQATAGRSATEIPGFTLRAASFALLIDGSQTGAP